MTFLPVVARELRVASRQPATWRWRILAAAIFAVIAGMIGAYLVTISRLGALSAGGGELFATLRWIAFACCLLAGLRFTADAISEERREGTLGLLFLTDLRGYDVVLGKLFATSLTPVYALVGALPILGISILLGGVTATVFWQTVLALLKTLLLSLAAGLCVSAFVTSVRGALFWTGCLVGVVTFLPRIIQENFDTGEFGRMLTLFSPLTAFDRAAYDPSPYSGRGSFWTALTVSHATAWLMIGLASIAAARTWQRDKTLAAVVPGAIGTSVRSGRRIGRAALLERNPVAWLDDTKRWQRISGRLFVLGYAGFWIYEIIENSSSPAAGGLIMLSFMPGMGLGLLKLWVAVQAAHRFAEDRRSGALELLLATPLTVEQIIQGRFVALRRQFLLLLFVVAAIRVGVLAWSLSMAPANGVSFGWDETVALGVARWLEVIVELFLDAWALSWLGLWLGLRCKGLLPAVSLMFLWIMVAPWFAMMICMTVVMALSFSSLSRGVSSGNWILYVMFAVQFLLVIAADLTAVVYARKQLRRRFREIAASRFNPPAAPKLVAPPILAEAAGSPAA